MRTEYTWDKVPPGKIVKDISLEAGMYYLKIRYVTLVSPPESPLTEDWTALPHEPKSRGPFAVVEVEDATEVRQQAGEALLVKNAELEAMAEELRETMEERDNLRDQMLTLTRRMSNAQYAFDQLERALFPER